MVYPVYSTKISGIRRHQRRRDRLDLVTTLEFGLIDVDLDSFPLKQRWSPSIFSTTLVAVSSNHAVESEPRNDREIEEERINRTWSACNPLSACSNGNSVQITPISDGNGGSTAADKENREVGALDTSFLSLQQPQNDGTLSANVSASHLEELVMKEAEDPKAPLVILFGWAGCRDRYLSKYSAYYQKEG